MFYYEEYAQTQSALYETFLDSLQAHVLALKASGQKPTGRAIKEAGRFFDKRADDFVDWFFKAKFDMECELYVNDADWFKYEGDWLYEFRRIAVDAVNRSLASNKSTYISALRFGGSFGGLSDWLKDVHGNMGLLVQKKSTEMRWNMRTADGKTVSCLRTVHLACRNYSYRLCVYKTLIEAAKEDLTVAIYNPKDGIVCEMKAKKILNSKSLRDRYFYFNSKNEIW